MSIDQDIANSARQLATDVKINHDIINGNENTEVATEGGPVPSIRKRLKDIESEWAKTADPLADDLASTVLVTKEYKNDAANSAALAAETLPKVTAEGDKQVARVTNEGGQQVGQVQSIGQQQEALVNAAGVIQIDKVENAGATAQQAAQHAQVIADKFGDVDVAVTATTEQADRAKTEADRAEKAATGVVTETEEQIKNIQAVGVTEIGKVNRAGAGQVDSIKETGAEQSQTINTISDSKKNEITTIANSKIADINAAGVSITTLVDNAEAIVDQAETAATEAKKAEANATAIVHNDEGHTTPTPGAYPVADSNGYLDIGWTPLLAAMYPHSGVIGSVDKNKLFSFFITANQSDWGVWINQFCTMNSTYNIAGRFVHLKQDYKKWILPEAESTVDRAIAFDDIFLDWNGNVQTYRSITPYRTTTGYDRDAIATEHGYTKIQTGLYKTSDTYALLLGRVARRNQGAYHPEFNPEGARWPLATQSTINHWYKDTAIKLTNSTDAFNISYSTDGTDGPGGYLNSGNLKLNRSGRPDEKLYDAIYADDFTALYYSAINVSDYYTLAVNSLKEIINNNTFCAAEGLQNRVGGILASITVDDILDQKALKISGVTYSNTVKPEQNIHISGYIYSNSQLIARTGYVYKNRDLRITHGIENIIKGYVYTLVFFERTSSETDLEAQINGVAIKNLPIQKQYEFIGKTDSARPEFQMIDIIGLQEAWPEEWITHGLPGNYLDVGEEGQSLAPDSSSKTYKLSRPCLQLYEVISTRDKGQTWQELTSVLKLQIEGSVNGFTEQLYADQVVMIFYKTSANPLNLSLRSEVINMTEGYVSNYSEPHAGSALCSNLINKIPTGTGNQPDFNFYFPLTKTTFDESKKFMQSSHLPLEIAKHNPGFKAIGYLSSENSHLFLNLCYKEVRVKDNILGDNGLLIAYNNQIIETDLNGESVIVGTKRVELPFLFDGDTY